MSDSRERLVLIATGGGSDVGCETAIGAASALVATD
jgi:hypothetical protein